VGRVEYPKEPRCVWAASRWSIQPSAARDVSSNVRLLLSNGPGRGSRRPEKKCLAQDAVEPESGDAAGFHHDLLSLDDRARVRRWAHDVNRRDTLGDT